MQYDRIYIRFNSRTLGPITQSKAEDLIRRHQITAQHELSADGISWQPAETMLPLAFSPVVTEKPEPAKVEPKPVSQQPAPQGNPPVPQERQWFAIVDGVQRGPVAEVTIRNWIALGMIIPESKVWTEGMAEYQDAGIVQPNWFAVRPPAERSIDPNNFRLAGQGKRLLAVILDSLSSFLCLIPGFGLIFTGMALNPNEPSALFFAGVGVLLLGGLSLFLIQIYLLATQSQTIGKRIMKIQIVDHLSGRPADWVHTILLRTIVNGFIAGIPCLGAIYGLVDVFFIFREDRRCVHDLLANTSVIDISN